MRIVEPKTRLQLARAAIVASLALLVFAINSLSKGEQHSGAKSPDHVSTLDGQQTFSSACAPCHGLDGRGGERAPDIATRPEVTKLPDEDLMRILRVGIPEKGMPPFGDLGATKLSALLRYLRSLQGKGAATSIRGNSQLGKELFAGKAGCSGCHMINGAGGFLGRDLSTYGETHTASEIRAAIVEPPKASGPRGRTADVTTRGGKSYSGVVRNEDNFSVQLQSPDGSFHFLSKADLVDFRYRQESLMPSDYGSKLSSVDLDALAAYIAGLAHTKQKHEDDAFLQ